MKNFETKELINLIGHMWVHSGYARNGYSKMTSEQKKLFDEVIEEYTQEEE